MSGIGHHFVVKEITISIQKRADQSGFDFQSFCCIVCKLSVRRRGWVVGWLVNRLARVAII